MYGLKKHKKKRISKKFFLRFYVIMLLAVILLTPIFVNVELKTGNEIHLKTANSAMVYSDWTWISGSKIINDNAVYGTKGYSEIGNYPGARSRSVSWVGENGDLWLFGGRGYNESGASGWLNDLWYYSLTLNMWTWMSGSNMIGEPGVYGDKGISSPENCPGARDGAFSWTDNDGNLLLFGGNGKNGSVSTGNLNDLWKYNITSMEWTWMSGNNTLDVYGEYGTMGTSSSMNYPGGREHSVSWKDNEGNLWLFGGWGYAESGFIGYLNDLWRFNITSMEWTWMSGNSTTKVNGEYGTKGISSPTNYPGGRYQSVSWRDTNSNFWLFGGVGRPEASAAGCLNDLWRFSITSNEWTWISGDNIANQTGIYGTKGVSNSGNNPGARRSSISWMDKDGDFWLFGGWGFPIINSDGSLNDLWRFSITSNEWTWISGSSIADQTGIYGTKGVSNSENYPGGRYDSISWIDDNGNMWLFGGRGLPESGSADRLNDLWMFTIKPVPPNWLTPETILIIVFITIIAIGSVLSMGVVRKRKSSRTNHPVIMKEKYSSESAEILKGIKQKTEDIGMILKLMRDKGENITRGDIVKELKFTLDEADEYLKILDTSISYKKSEISQVKVKAEEALRQFTQPTLYDLILKLGYDYILAMKVGAYLRKEGLIKKFRIIKKKKTEGKHKAGTIEKIKLDIKRGGDWEIEGDQSIFKYKVKVFNPTDVMLTNVQILLTSISSALETESKHYKIEYLRPNAYESPTFNLKAKESCVGCVIESVITYIDHLGKQHSEIVEPLKLDYVCNLLTPKMVTETEYIRKTASMDKRELIISSDLAPQDLEAKLSEVLQNNNFFLLDKVPEPINSQVREFKGYAEGKYDREEVALSVVMQQMADQTTNLIIKAMSEREEKLIDLLRDINIKIDDVKSTNELILEYSKNIEVVMDEIDNLEQFLVRNLGTDYEKIKHIWIQYKEGQISKRDMILESVKVIGKRFIKIFIGRFKS